MTHPYRWDDTEYVKRISKYVDIPDIEEGREPIFQRIQDEHYKRFIDGDFLKSCYDEIKARPDGFTGSTSGYDMILFAESVLRVALKFIAYHESTMVFLLQMHEDEKKMQAGLTTEQKSKL